MNKMKLLTDFYNFRDVYQIIKNISWQISNFEKRFPMPEAMTDKELQMHVETYIALFSKLKEAIKLYRKAYKIYQDE